MSNSVSNGGAPDTNLERVLLFMFAIKNGYWRGPAKRIWFFRPEVHLRPSLENAGIKILQCDAWEVNLATSTCAKVMCNQTKMRRYMVFYITDLIQKSMMLPPSNLMKIILAVQLKTWQKFILPIGVTLNTQNWQPESKRRIGMHVYLAGQICCEK